MIISPFLRRNQRVQTSHLRALVNASGGHPRERGTTWRQSHCGGKESLERARDQLLRMSFDEDLDSAVTETIIISFGFLENFLWFLKPVLLRFLMLSTEKNSS